MLKVPKKNFGPRGLFLTYRVSRIEYTAETSENPICNSQ